MSFFSWIKSIFQKGTPIINGVSFPNAITKEEYYKRKAEKENKALSDTRFWEKLEVDIFAKNLEYCKNNICPYCGEKLPERKGKSYKCPSCKGKIYRKREILTTNEGLFTEQEKETLDNLLHEYQERKAFLELWRKAQELVNITLDETKKYNIKSAAQQAIIALHMGKVQYYMKKNLVELRNCRMVEGEFQRKFGTIQQATNCYMQILYLDLIDDFETAFSEVCLDCDVDIDDNGEFIIPKDTKGTILKKALKIFSKKTIYIAPAIYQWAFQEDLTVEKFEQIFKFNAKNLQEQIKPKPPVSPDEAWEKILEYRKDNK